MNVIFLDIDGVLNNNYTTARTPMGYTGIDETLLERFANLVKETGAVVVLSTTWKDEWGPTPGERTADGEYLQQKMDEVGIVIVGKTDESEVGPRRRGAAIQAYLDSHPDIDAYVIVDDWDFDFEEYPEVESHFVQTDSDFGITYDTCSRMQEIMQMEREYGV